MSEIKPKENYNFNSMQQKGGIVSANKMTKEQRIERARKASHSRKSIKNLIGASHTGSLTIGNVEISCAVLDDGKRVITESSMFEILGRKRGGRERGAELPRFLGADNLKPFINNDLLSGSNVITFRGVSGKNYGYEAKIIPEICRVYLDARNAGILTANQLPTARRCEIILHSLAKVGITALIDSATGYEVDREKYELQKLFNKFISDELRPWTKKFPDSFFENIKRLYGLQHLKGNPSFCGHIINGLIYDEISPDIKTELQKRNPITEEGYRKVRHHQLLTTDIGCPALEKQIVKVNTIMDLCDSKEEFDSMWKKLKNKCAQES